MSIYLKQNLSLTIYGDGVSESFSFDLTSPPVLVGPYNIELTFVYNG